MICAGFSPSPQDWANLNRSCCSSAFCCAGFEIRRISPTVPLLCSNCNSSRLSAEPTLGICRIGVIVKQVWLHFTNTVATFSLRIRQFAVEVMAFELMKNLTSAIEHFGGDAGKAGDMDSVTLVRAAGGDLVHEHD